MMESVRALQVATHFKRVPGPDPDDPTKMRNDRLVPCSPGDPEAFPLTITEITEPKLVMSLPVTKLHFLKALRTARPSVSDSDILQHIKFTQEFGQEG
jgi:vacuolar protein-sorting-associated protein 4